MSFVDWAILGKCIVFMFWKNLIDFNIIDHESISTKFNKIECWIEAVYNFTIVFKTDICFKKVVAAITEHKLKAYEVLWWGLILGLIWKSKPSLD